MRLRRSPTESMWNALRIVAELPRLGLEPVPSDANFVLFGHLEDARILTERDGANPDLWMEVKQRLPLLADKAHYSTVKRGFARGQEPVDYVDNIPNYYDLLVWYTTTTDANMRHRLLAEEPGEPVIPPVANATAR